MPDSRLHRGAHPQDAALFATDQWPVLHKAAAELNWLLDRGYAPRSSLTLVGDRHALAARQRLALARATCSQAQQRSRQQKEVPPAAVQQAPLWIDGYNALITAEAALAGGVLLRGRDGCIRDMASLHGTYRHVEETEPALTRLGAAIAACGCTRAHWVLDRPVANSARLKGLMERLFRDHGWAWSVQLEPSPDGLLARVDGVVATSDSAVLDRAQQWFNLNLAVLERMSPPPALLDLTGEPEVG